MAACFGSAAILLVLATSVHTQFFDFFPAFQPFATNQPTYGSIYDVTRRDQSKNYYKQTTKQEETTKSYENDRSNPFLPQFGGERDQNDYRRRKTTTSTVKPRKKATARRLVNNDKRTNNQDYNNNNKEEYDGKINVIGDYFTQKPSGNNRQEYNNNYSTDKPNYGYNRPDYGIYSTQKPNYGNNNRPDYSNNYSTENPFNKGVKPVVTNGPPITNKPVTRSPIYGVDPRPKDDDSIAFPDDDASPEVIIGPDEDLMSVVEKKRYIELAERKCNEYKALGTKAVQAIPLLPSPEPVQISVPRCTPTTIPLVVGGKVVSIQEFPHMALLGWRKLQGGGYSWKCGGSLVSEQFVLTAAHCSFQDRDNTVDNGPPTAVQLGSSYLDDPGALVVRVAAVIRHPKYKLPRSYYDLALVKLAHAVKFSEVIKPACLGSAPAVGKSIIATGWGRTQYGGGQSHELRSVSLPVWEMSRCQDVLGTSRKLPEGPSSDSQICAGEERGGKDTCQGDSGGPAQVQEECIWRVVGVTSLGRSCGAAETPGLYAKLQRAFIASQVFGSQNIRNYTSNNADSGYNNANSDSYNGNSWNNNNGGNNGQDSVHTERPYNIDYNNRRQQGSNPHYNTQRPNGNVNNNAGTYYNNREQDDYNTNRPNNQQVYNNNNQQSINNRVTRYTTQKPIRSDGIVFNYNNDENNGQQNYYTTRKPVRYNNAYDNANSQNYESNNTGNSDYNKNNNVGYNNYNSQNYSSNNREQSNNNNNQSTQNTQSNYGDNRQSNYENYTINKPWWLT